MKKFLILTTALAALSAGSMVLADNDGGRGARGDDDDGGYAMQVQGRKGGFLNWLKGGSDDDDEGSYAAGYGDDDDDDDDAGQGGVRRIPQPSTPPANGLFGSGTPSVQVN